MEKITNIEIKNFKSIRHQKIDGCKRINVFIGYPNVGKSNILEALGLCSYINDDDINYKELSFNKLCRLKSFTELFTDGDSNEPAEISFDNLINISLSYLNESTLEFSLFKNKSVSEGWKNIWGFEIVKGGQSIHPKKMYFANEKQRAKPKSGIKILKYQFVKSKFTIQSASLNLLFPNGENLFEIIEHNKKLRTDIASLFEYYNLKLSFDKTKGTITIIKELEKNIIFQIPFNQIADTLQRLIFYKAAIASNKNSMLLFEEPEAHMFPPYIKSLTSDIILDKNNNQYFIATHSPFVLNELIEEAQDELSVYVVDYDKGETIIKRLTDEEVTEISQYGIDLFFNLESYLEKNGQPHSA